MLKSGFGHLPHLILLTSTLLVVSTSTSFVSAQEKSATVKVQFKTSMGDFALELNQEKAPATVENFVKYVEDDFYNGTIFHRIIPDFMVQGGGFDVKMTKKDVRPPIRNEAGNGLKNDKYTVAMARTSDPHSATAQFFINNGTGNSFLNRSEARDGFGYAVFGKVTEGFDVIDKMSVVKTRSTPVQGQMMQNVPVETITILEAKVIKE